MFDGTIMEIWLSDTGQWMCTCSEYPAIFDGAESIVCAYTSSMPADMVLAKLRKLNPDRIIKLRV